MHLPKQVYCTAGATDSEWRHPEAYLGSNQKGYHRTMLCTFQQGDFTLAAKNLKWMLIGLAYATALVLASLAIGRCDLLCFAHIGPRWLYNDTSSPLGYDGQFAYFIATDPTNAPAHLDAPAYRYQRILYPLLARMLAQGRADFVPFALVVVNILGIGVATAAFSSLLAKEDAPRWTPLLFFAWFGTGHSLLYDLNEITAMSLSLLALLLSSERRYLWAGIFFGLAALGKDLAFLFAIPVTTSLVLKRSWGNALQIGFLSLSPYLIWMLLLRYILGAWSIQAARLQSIPFAGLSRGDPSFWFVILLLIIPGALCVALALRHWGDTYALATLASFAFLALLPSFPADGVFRVSTALVVAGALLLARLGHRTLLQLFGGIWAATATLAWLIAIYPLR